ncbi:unnamed protein product [Lasius platythorax]|uniref:Uncharacterized protein n=1 Tax=Lasius platythorax TaxID=488582 RepID=A0AAV2NGC8_9HYME
MTETVVHGNFAIEVFDPNVTNWNRWLRRFEGAATVFKVPEAQKVAYLLHFIGSGSFDFICDKLAPLDPYTQSYAVLTARLAEFYAPVPLEIAENYRFHQRKQGEGESVQQFVAALHKLSINCNFGQYLQTALRNQLVFGLLSKRAQSRLLETKDLNFEKVEMAIAMELSEKDVDQIQAGPANVISLNQKDKSAHKKNDRVTARKKIQGKSNAFINRRRNGGNSGTHNGSDINIICFRCGGKHLATVCTLDRNIVCRSCSTKGHLQKVCKRKSKVAANELGEILSAQTEHNEFREKYYTTVILGEKEARFEIDSGAAVTIDRQILEKLWDYNPPEETEILTNRKDQVETSRPRDPEVLRNAEENVTEENTRTTRGNRNEKEVLEQGTPRKSKRICGPPKRYGDQPLK